MITVSVCVFVSVYVYLCMCVKHEFIQRHDSDKEISTNFLKINYACRLLQGENNSLASNTKTTALGNLVLEWLLYTQSKLLLWSLLLVSPYYIEALLNSSQREQGGYWPLF